jgi:hypothetical protein
MSHSFLWVLAWVTFMTPLAWAQDCPTPHTPDQVHTRLTAAQKALRALDSDGFSLAMQEVALMVPCLNERPTPELVAEIHRMHGIDLYTAGKQEHARLALRASRILGPQYRFPADLFPKGHALPDLWLSLSALQPAHVRAPVPKQSQVVFDGTVTRNRPSDRATVFQHLGKDGSVQTTRYLMPKDPLPSYPSIPRQRNRLIAASIATGAVAGASYALAWQGRSQFMKSDPKQTKKDLNTTRNQVNTAFVTAGICTTLSATGIAAAILVGPR